jgi:hypothetical protein
VNTVQSLHVNCDLLINCSLHKVHLQIFHSIKDEEKLNNMHKGGEEWDISCNVSHFRNLQKLSATSKGCDTL